ncbi:MAG: cyclopropane fatty acyl phospholipid synthase [Desulfohalobium sp.]
MRYAKRKCVTLLQRAGITINGDAPWDIQVHDERLYWRMLRDKHLGFGEAYMDGWWDCPRVDMCIHRLLCSEARATAQRCLAHGLLAVLSRISNRQKRSRSREIAEKHYDLDNNLFFSFLDTYNQYSCAYFTPDADLEQAQQNKLAMTCRKLELNSEDTVLDIGCGWGGFAKYAAERFGCQVTGVNISQEQVAFARQDCQGLPVTIVEQDYREIQDRFDKVVSIGMFEHVGPKNHAEFMRQVDRCLQPEGVFLLHTIGSNRSRHNADPWISKYIFPNGSLPSVRQIARAAEPYFVMEDWHNFGPHYDSTLMAWHERFQQAWPQLATTYSQRFKRMWEYSLQSCAGAFRSRSLQVWQIVFSKGRSPQPQCR